VPDEDRDTFLSHLQRERERGEEKGRKKRQREKLVKSESFLKANTFFL
jgi:hypothetical protein